MADTPPTSTRMTRALRGALEGTLYGGLLGFVLALVTSRGLAVAWQQALVVAGFGAFTFAIGRAVTGGVFFAVAGGLCGIALGVPLGDRWIGYYRYSLPDLPPAIPHGQEMQIAGPTLQGQAFDLQTLRGKVVLVDFWATWCLPCVAELPNVREVYDRYHQDGFEVVGVSLDTSRERLAEFVAQKQIPWPQVFFGEERHQGWNNPLARQYEISAIPATFLLDQHGRIVAEDVRGSALGPAVANLLGKELPPNTNENVTTGKRFALFRLGLVVGAILGCIAGCWSAVLAESLFRRLLASRTLESRMNESGSPS